jgi:hypothetical protein
VIGALSEVRTNAVAKITGTAGFRARGTVITAKMLFLAGTGESTFIGGLIKSIVPMCSTVFLDFFRNCRWIFTNSLSDFAKGLGSIQPFLNGNPVILCHVFMVARYTFRHNRLFLLRIGDSMP